MAKILLWMVAELVGKMIKEAEFYRILDEVVPGGSFGEVKSSKERQLYLTRLSMDGLKENEQPVKPITYSLIKHGIIGLTKYIATYWADKGVRVNAILPGGVYTNQPDKFVTKISELIPLGRMAHEDEYKAAIVFLCSDASSYMTGSNLVIDGGRTIL